MAEITPELIETVLEAVGEGTPLRQLCREHNFSKSAWYRLMAADAELQGRFMRARDEGADAIAEEALEIADSADPARDVQRDKLRVETRLKLLAKWHPKKYGDRTLLGSDPENPLPAAVNVIDASKLSSEALREVIAAKGSK